MDTKNYEECVTELNKMKGKTIEEVKFVLDDNDMITGISVETTDKKDYWIRFNANNSGDVEVVEK